MSTTTCCMESIMLKLVLPPNTLQQHNSNSNSQHPAVILYNYIPYTLVLPSGRSEFALLQWRQGACH